MTRGVRLYLVGSFVLVSLAGCGRGLFQSSEREPWRAEAEVACLKSGAVRENPDLVRINPISGPGACGAEYPLKVAALGDSSSSLGFADDLRPPGSIGNAGPRWNSAPAPRNSYPEVAVGQPRYDAGLSGPMSLSAPGVAPAGEDDIAAELENDAPARGGSMMRNPYAQPATERPLPRLGPGPAAAPGNAVAAFGPVVIKPTATLACPIVSALDRWLADSVQPAAMRWFGSRVAEIKQISAYSCRGMNGNSRAHISEHAFGNALDIAAFTLADGRRISVKDGWKGMQEEQGFLREVQGSACENFNTVLAPGSNVYHYDHIHVDLMRRNSRRNICKPVALTADEIVARYAPSNRGYAGRDPSVTGSVTTTRRASRRKNTDDVDYGNE
ncbi:MAG: extensin [Tardiphaga sp.]|nr:extensin [Tardiphaga sp.]